MHQYDDEPTFLSDNVLLVNVDCTESKLNKFKIKQSISHLTSNRFVQEGSQLWLPFGGTAQCPRLKSDPNRQNYSCKEFRTMIYAYFFDEKLF